MQLYRMGCCGNTKWSRAAGAEKIAPNTNILELFASLMFSLEGANF